GCITAHATDPGHFANWQKLVIEAHRAVAKQELPGLVRKIALQPKLRDDLAHIQFSPDGRYMLAQDESSIFVLTREPLAALFRIGAPGAQAAQFSPDSKAVVFYDKELRVEKWDVASKQRTKMEQLTIPDCLQSELSHSGETLACVDYDYGLRIVDVEKN